jgi:hypothetical protein
VVTVMLGMNDGYYTNFDEDALQVFRENMESLAKTLKTKLPEVRITLIGTPPYDNVTPGEQPDWERSIDGGYDSVIVRYSQEMAKIAKRHELPFVDMHKPLVNLLKELQAYEPSLARQLIPDRIHPGNAAGLVMAAELLRAWHAPLPPSIEVEGMLLGNWPITRTFESPAAYSIESNPLTSYLFQKGNRLAFFSPPRLQIINLPLERVSLWLDDSDMGAFTQTELEKGIALPQNGEHSIVLAKLIDVRAKLRFKKWREGELASTKNADDLAKTEVEMIVNEMELEARRTKLNNATQHVLEIRKPLSE